MLFIIKDLSRAHQNRRKREGIDYLSFSHAAPTEYLSHQRIAYQVFAEGEAGLSAVQKGRIDALVYDRPLLLWLVNEHFSGSLRVLDATFDPQLYAIALPQGSELRIPIDLALLDAIRSDWWRETLLAYPGPG